MRAARRLLVGLLAALAAGLVGGSRAPAGVVGGERQTVTATFTSAVPGTATGLSLSAVYDNGLTPPGPPTVALVHVDDGLPPGTAIANAGVPRCTAGARRLISIGPAACPPGSIVGGGSAEIGLGLASGAGRITVPLTLINAPGQLLFLGRLPRLGVGMIDRGVILGSTIAIRIPRVPGLGLGGAVVDAEQFSIAPGSGLLRTPPSCPEAGWVLRRTHVYADGVTQVARVVLPCAPR